MKTTEQKAKPPEKASFSGVNIDRKLTTEIEMRNLAPALVQVLQMWSNERYKDFLRCAQPGALDEKWFRWFVGAWNVARTIKDGQQAHVREYLEAFNEYYARRESQLESVLKERWVADLAKMLGCPAAVLATIAMRRKLFDDYLMHAGEYRK